MKTLKLELLDITPSKYKCHVGESCPAIFEAGQKHVIIGRFVSAADYDGLVGRIGPGEVAIEVESEMLTDAFRKNKTK